MAAYKGRERPRDTVYLALLLFLLVTLRNCGAGWQYWYQLDDYIQYHNYAAGFTFPELQKTVGVLSSRPLAGLADYFVWSPMFGKMLVAVTILAGMYVVSIFWMKGLLERYVPVGPVFPIVMALLPLGVEGTYWVSASSRIIPGLFFACAAARAFGAWLERGKRRWAAVFVLLMLIPFGFYEQAAVLAMTLVLGMALLECRRWGRRSLLALWVFPAAALYFAVTGLLSDGGVYASRSELMLPWYDGYVSSFLPDILGQIKTVFGPGLIWTLCKGVFRGIGLIWSEKKLVWTLLVLLLCVLYGGLLFHVAQTEKKSSGKQFLAALGLGVILTIAPLTPFLILANPWFSFRGAVTSFAGLALLCDAVVCFFFDRLPGGRKTVSVLAVLAAVVCCVAGMSEITDYRSVWAYDQQAADAALERLTEDFPTKESRTGVRVGILGLEATYLEDSNYLWHEHGQGCTESDWAFNGLMVSKIGEGQLPSVTPLHSEPIYRHWNAAYTRPETFDVLYYYDGQSLTPAELRPSADGEHNFQVYLREDRGETQLLGVIWEEDGEIGYFQLETEDNG